MATTITPAEEAQLQQTIEMFEVITQSQPSDYQSLEILKEAYLKLGRHPDVIATSKRIAQAYVHLGQLSSAILEYETILQRAPDDPEVIAALLEIEQQANKFSLQADMGDTIAAPRSPKLTGRIPTAATVEDGKADMAKVFVETKLVAQADFDACWPLPDLLTPPLRVVEPFVLNLINRKVLDEDKILKTLSDKARLPFFPLSKYDPDLELMRSFPAATCRRWCVLPFDRLSKSVLVATLNPYNRQAMKELQEASASRMVWYLVPPVELINLVQRAFR